MNVGIWFLAYAVAVYDLGVSERILLAVVAVRAVGEFGLLGGYQPISTGLDRLAWIIAILGAIARGDWVTSLVAFTLAVLWYFASAKGSNYYARAHTGWDTPPR